MRTSAAHIGLAIGLAVVASCTTPASRFYTLSALSTPTSQSTTTAIAVGPISVPDVVDRPEFVVQAGENELRLEEFNRWASPLQDNLARVVGENLVALLGTPNVTQFPSTVTVPAEFRVAIEVQRFESSPGDAAALDAVWTVSRVKDGASETGRTSLREEQLSGGYAALAAAHSRSVARMSAQIAEAVERMR